MKRVRVNLIMSPVAVQKPRCLLKEIQKHGNHEWVIKVNKQILLGVKTRQMFLRE